MGKVIVAVKLNNDYDWIRWKNGEIGVDGIRTVKVDGLVDAGATMLVIPESIVRQIGIPIVREVTVFNPLRLLRR